MWVKVRLKKKVLPEQPWKRFQIRKQSVLAYKHFSEPNHNSQQHGEFTVIERIRKQMTTKETIKLLKKQENFWILNLKGLYPDGLNQELNYID